MTRSRGSEQQKKRWRDARMSENDDKKRRQLEIEREKRMLGVNLFRGEKGSE